MVGPFCLITLESQRKEIELHRQELVQETKLLVSKKKQLLLSPFNELHSEPKLRELISHFKKAHIQSIPSGDLDIEFESYLRREMFQISTLDDIDKLRTTADRVVKLEYILLKEKSKMHLVSQYVDAAIQELEAEKEEYRVMRHKYENLVGMEKDLHRYKQDMDEKEARFSSMLAEFRDRVYKVFDYFRDIIQVKKGNSFSIHTILELDLNDSKKPLWAKLESQDRFKDPENKRFIRKGLHEQLNQSLKDIDIIIDVQKSLLNDVRECNEHKLLKDLKQQWEAQQLSSLSNQSILAITSKKLEKMEWIKKVLDTESKFLDEERKWVERERNAILNQKSREHGNKLNFLGTLNSDSFDFINSSLKGPRHRHTDSEVNKTKDKLENEIEVLEKYTDEIRNELDRINEEKLILIDKDEVLQKEKLNLLLQYESIKKLENFYNEYHPKDQQILVEGIEIDHGNIRELFQKYLKISNKENPRFYDTKDHSLMITFSLYKMIYCLFHIACFHQYPEEDKLLIYFHLWKAKTQLDKQIDSRKLKIFSINTYMDVTYKAQDEDTWFEIFWERNKAKMLSQHVISDRKRTIHEEHLYVERKRIERDMKRYWKFKSQKALKMLFLHLRRKLRYILAFSFMKYRINVLVASRQKIRNKPRFLTLKE